MKNKDREKILKHLADYYRKRSGKNMKSLERGYILPKDEAKKNLIKSSFFDREEKIYDDITKHVYFRHLNSSQAMTINFAVPLIEKEKLNVLIENDKSKKQNPKIEKRVCEDTFEKKLRVKTDFDLLIKTEEKYHFYEFKYSENSFGSAKKNDSHIKIYNDTYKPVLNKICKGDVDVNKFLKEYQLWRNICHVAYMENKTGEVYFVFPEFRDDLNEKVEDAKKALKDEYQNHVHILIIDEIVEKFKNSKEEDLKNHYTEFYEKYLNIEF